MQEDAGLLVRAKALSVFRACMEQMEMYKDTSAYRENVKRFIDGAMGPWVAALNKNLGVDITTVSEEDYNAVVKLTHATYKVCPLIKENADIDSWITGTCFCGSSDALYPSTTRNHVFKTRQNLPPLSSMSVFFISLTTFETLRL